MQLNRLIETVFILLQDGNVTARSLAERFSVSPRTIYRDIDVLSAAGIPVFTDKGNGGGIFIAPEYQINNALLSKAEQEELFLHLKSQSAANSGLNKILEKLGSVFKSNSYDFIEVDFSDWKNNGEQQDSFDCIKKAIIDKKVLEFEYYNSAGESSTRSVEPLKLIYKHRAWYFYGFCRLRKQNRLFRLSRMSKLNIAEENYDRICENKEVSKSLEWTGDIVEIELEIDGSLAARVFDEFERQQITQKCNGDFSVNMLSPFDEWVTNYILSYGDKVRVISPQWLKQKVRDIHKAAYEAQSSES